MTSANFPTCLCVSKYSLVCLNILSSLLLHLSDKNRHILFEAYNSAFTSSKSYSFSILNLVIPFNSPKRNPFKYCKLRD